MEGQWEVLQYYDNHWKASKLMMMLYSVWYNQYHKKAIKSQNNNVDEGRPPNKKARTLVNSSGTISCPFTTGMNLTDPIPSECSTDPSAR